MVAMHAGTTAVAGYGRGVRLEYFILPIAFGLGAPLVALVGANVGAGKIERARRIALVGGALAFVLTETVGLVLAVWPEAWLRLFDTDPRMIEVRAEYLRIVGPTYGFFGLGFSLYFASQGARSLKWPLLAGFIRLAIAAGGGWVALTQFSSLPAFFASSALAMVVYGFAVLTAVAARRGPFGRT